MFLLPNSASAFDYLEHLWFTDRSCADAQRMLAAQIESQPELVTAYLALALMCPTSWEKPYCERGYKRAQGQINQLETDSNKYSITLGDYSALADHVSRQGPVRNLPRARNNGLVLDTLRWLTDDSGVGGAIEDVAEDACETDGLADWASVERDVQQANQWLKMGAISRLPEGSLQPLARAAVNRGPHDAPMKYSYDNPHYLDLVLRNHHHFGEAAYESWNGFHSVAVRMREKTCAELIVVDADEAEDLADHVPGWGDVEWDDLSDEERPVETCRMMGEVVSRRLKSWAKVGPAALTEPARARIAALDAAAADEVVTNLLSLVFEGTGLHYLQDGLAGGHMRTIRSREALVEVRYDHDADNLAGVAAVGRTREQELVFIAWGDGYLLGAPPRSVCDLASTDPEVVTTCLLGHQRALLAAASRASIIDWALGGRIYEPDASCEGDLAEFACLALPIAATVTHGEPRVAANLRPSTLPVPPPNFSYESLNVGIGYAPFDKVPSITLRFAAFQELDQPAHWLTSWEARLESHFGERSLQNLTADIGYGFHFRFWARVMLDLVPTTFFGVRDFGNSIDFFAGVAPRIGFTLLPEGWVKIPIEFNFFADQPIILFSTDRAFFAEQFERLLRVGFGFGLAYMH